MKVRLIVVLALIVILPLTILGWLGAKVTTSEREVVQHRFRELLEDRLRGFDTVIANLLAQREREIMADGNLSGLAPEALRSRARQSGIVRQYFVLDRSGDLVYPSSSGPLSDSERAFIERTNRIWQNHEIPPANGVDDSAQAQALQPTKQILSKAGGKVPISKGKVFPQPSFKGKGGQPAPVPAPPPPPTNGWHVWFWESGVNLMLWWRDGTGAIVGAELDRVRLMADIVGALPDTGSGLGGDMIESGADPFFRLTDSRAETIYQWGVYEPGETEEPRAEIRLSRPLSAWKLELYLPAEYAGGTYGRGVVFSVLSGLGVLAVAMVALAIYFYRESSREMREAAQRVSFVNQVSHELKTPLTSIRMYAEMLDGEVDETDERARKHLGVIVAESQRLSRLIGNVLTFGRKERSALRIHRAEAMTDDVLREVLGNYEAVLLARGIRVLFKAGAPWAVWIDRDVLEQIVGNLLSNVEKYAGTGDLVEVASNQDAEIVTVTVSDNGPGIPAKERDRIFDPFHRVSNRLTDGVAGTGIGLAIARDLARLHGGDVTLEPATEGARFKLTLLAAPVVDPKEFMI